MYEKSSHKDAFQAASLPGCVVCHSNHEIQHPTDAKLGTGPEAACMQCHSLGDACDQARAKMLSELTSLDQTIKSANAVLNIAESSGMEVSEARLEHFINKSANNPVTEHKDAGIDMSLMIHDQGFVAWHQHFLAELETWLVNNGGSQFVPFPYWDPAKPIPAQLNKNT